MSEMAEGTGGVATFIRRIDTDVENPFVEVNCALYRLDPPMESDVPEHDGASFEYVHVSTSRPVELTRFHKPETVIFPSNEEGGVIDGPGAHLTLGGLRIFDSHAELLEVYGYRLAMTGDVEFPAT